MVATLLILAGCAAGDDPGGAEGFTVVDSAGTRIVLNETPVHGDGVWTVTPEPRVRIGAIDGADPASQFSFIGSVLRLSDGRIVVLESQVGELRYFGPDGEHLVSVGRRGQGPGEFTYPSRAMRWTGDTVVVEDRPRADQLFFAPDGTFARELIFDLEGMLERLNVAECADLTLADLSRVVCVEEAGQPPRVADPGPGHHRSFTRFVRLPWDLSSVDTLGLYGGIEQWGVRGAERTHFAVHPFHSRTHTATLADPIRIAIARNPEYSIEVWSPDGRLERIVRRTDGRRVPTADEVDRAEESLRERARGDDALANRFVAEVPVPDSLYAVSSLAYSEAGELLVGRSHWIGDMPRTQRFDVFDAEGRWLGEIELPGGFRVHEVGDDYILGVRQDELGVPWVEMFGLTRN